ncbi:uncharacterized protein ACMZJ9_018982 [Mantella aurantiaca]
MDGAGGMMSVQPIPQHPVIQGSVTLSVTGITGKIETFTWYKGLISNSTYLILSYFPGDRNPLTPGSLFNDRMTPFPNGSLQISNLNITDEGNYIVNMQTDKSYDIHVYLKIYRSAVLTQEVIDARLVTLSVRRTRTSQYLCEAKKVEDPMMWETECTSRSGLGGGEIAAIVIGTVVGIFILEAIVYCVLKAKRHTPTDSVYENAHVPEQHNYEMTLPEMQENTSQDSNYERCSASSFSLTASLASHVPAMYSPRLPFHLPLLVTRMNWIIKKLDVMDPYKDDANRHKLTLPLTKTGPHISTRDAFGTSKKAFAVMERKSSLRRIDDILYQIHP